MDRPWCEDDTGFGRASCEGQSLPAYLEGQRRQGAGSYWICVIVTEYPSCAARSAATAPSDRLELTMTADRIMQTTFWALRLMAVNMTVSCSLLDDGRVIAVLALRHGKPLPGYTASRITGQPHPDTGEAARLNRSSPRMTLKAYANADVLLLPGRFAAIGPCRRQACID